VTSCAFVGNDRVDAWPAGNRLEAYGDGLFETMRVHRGEVPWWDFHWQRLARGAARLRLPVPDQSLVREAAAAMFDDRGDGVLKLLLGRGGMARGYAPVANAAPLWMVSRHALPPMRAEGLHAHWCGTRLSIQPALAGLKHCNRLEQVIARAECDDAGADEGLMLDGEDRVVSGIAGNVFAFIDGKWSTPAVDRCGVAGVCRAQLIDALQASEGTLSVAQVERADAVFLSNAVRGILPLARLGTRTWPVHPAIEAARRRLADRHPGFAPDAAMKTERS